MSVKSEIPNELKSWFKIFDQLSNRHDYITVFDDYLLMVLNWFANAEFKDQWLDRKRRYNDKELRLFNELYMELMLLFKKQVEGNAEWYDPFGNMYQILSSRGKASRLGQFFTPEELCTMTAGITMPKTGIEWVVGDPACGSGRMLLAAHTVNRTCHFIAQDSDKMCCMMTAVNMALHLMSGVVIHGNTLSMETYSYWRVYRVEVAENQFLPAIKIITKEEYEKWHQERIFVSKWINKSQKNEFDPEATAEIVSSSKVPESLVENVPSNGTESNTPVHKEVQSTIFVETNKSNELPVKVQQKKSKIIINPDNQLSLF